MTTQPTDIKGAFSALSVGGKVAAAAVVIAAAAGLWSLFELARSMFGPSPRPSTVRSDATNAAKQHAEGFDWFTKQIDGRTLFVLPAEKTEVVDAPPPADEEPTDPPKPTRYGGPPVIAMINDTAWFRDGKRLVVGGSAEGDLRVLRIVPPWEVVVEWKGVEFTVGLFDRDRVVFKDAAAPPPTVTQSGTPTEPPVDPDEDEEETPKAGPATVPTPPAPPPATPDSAAPTKPAGAPAAPQAPDTEANNPAAPPAAKKDGSA